METSVILAVLSLVEGILPLVTGSQNATTVTAIDNIIDALGKMLPAIVQWSESLYTAVTNIISTLNGSGTLSPDQIASTMALQASVDAAWSAVVNKVDPDNPANAGTAAGDPGATAAPAAPPAPTT